MRPYTPNTKKGRTVGCDDIHHKTADQPKRGANAAANTMRSATRQDGQRIIESELSNMSGSTTD
jgi:hypothetical protein